MDFEIRSFGADKVLGTQVVSKELFGIDPSDEILSRVIRWQLAKKMQGSHATKGISDVSGTTKKPFRQKGTGNARLGTKRAPQCRGGGVVFGPKVRSHAHKLNKKVRALGLRMSVAQKIQENKMFFVRFEEERTKSFSAKLKDSQWGDSCLIVCGEEECEVLRKGCRNIERCNYISSAGYNVYSAVRNANLIFTPSGWETFEKRFSI